MSGARRANPSPAWPQRSASAVPQTPPRVELWTVEEVGHWLSSVKLPQCRDEFRRQGVDGGVLAHLRLADLPELGVASVDLTLIHFPCSGKDASTGNAQTWRAMEDFHSAGKSKAIGV